MQEMKKVVIVNGKAIFDIENLLARLLVDGQQRGVEVKDIFQYKLSHVPWPVAGTAGDLALSFGVRLSSYRPEAKKMVLFDRYYEDEQTAKVHERMRRA